MPLRQFVQFDWFLPVFILHDRDRARGSLGMFHTHPGPGLVGPFECRVYFHMESNGFGIINNIWSKFVLLKCF